jgi:hypothetical protein
LCKDASLYFQKCYENLRLHTHEVTVWVTRSVTVRSELGNKAPLNTAAVPKVNNAAVPKGPEVWLGVVVDFLAGNKKAAFAAFQGHYSYYLHCHRCHRGFE